MALYLVQNGRSVPKDIDPDQGLSQDGIAETRRIAGVAADYGVKISRIRHSGKTRARQTAEIFAAALNPANGTQELAGLKPLDDVVAAAAAIDPDANTMLIGHLPFMERITAYLVTGSADNSVFKFQNSGIVCLGKDPQTDSWVIVWTLMPKIG